MGPCDRWERSGRQPLPWRPTTADPAADGPRPRATVPGPQGGDGSLMRPYELMIIFDADLDDQAIQDQADKVRQQVEGRGGRIAKTDRWGRRRLAYEINHKSEGFYIVFELLAEGGVDDLDRALR